MCSSDLGRNAPSAYFVFGNFTEHGSADSGVRHFGSGSVHAGRGGAELFGAGSAAAHAKPGKYVKRRPVPDCAYQTALALDSSGTFDCGAGDGD